MSFFNKNNKKRVKLILAGFALLFVLFINIIAPISKAQAQSVNYVSLFSGSSIKATATTETSTNIQIQIKTSDIANFSNVYGGGTDTQSFFLYAINDNASYKQQIPIQVSTSSTSSLYTSSLSGLTKSQHYKVGLFYKSDTAGQGSGSNITGISSVNDLYQIASTTFAAVGDPTSGGNIDPNSIQNGNEADNAPKAVASGSTGLPECFSDWTLHMAGCFAQGIYWAFFVPTSFIFSLSGQLLDWTMDYSLDSNSYNSTSFVAEGWKITRDLSNILFIFILLYTAIGTILGIGGVNAKQTIIKIVIVALFINFSLFFSQIVIDAGNIVGRIFYESMGVKKSDSLVSNAFQSEDTKSISVAVVSQFNPQNLFKEANSLNLNTPGGVEDQDKTTGTQPGQFAIISLIMSAINLVGAYIFFVVGFLFIGRVVGLWLAMIMAPLAFISYTLPGGFSLPGIGLADWFKKLVSMAFVVPVFLFFMYLIIKFLRVIDISQIIGNGQFTTTQVIMATCIPLAFIVILLMKAKETAVSMSGEVAKYAMQGANFVGGLAVGAATSGAALAGRATIGRLGASIANSESLKDKEAKGGISGKMASLALSAGRGTSSASFDARNVKVAGKDIAGATGFSVGKAKEGGYEQDRKDQVKKELDRKERLKVGEDSALTQEKYKADLQKIEAEKANKGDKAILDAVLNDRDSTKEERAEAKSVYNEKQTTKDKLAADARASKAQADIDKANRIRANNQANSIEKDNYIEKQVLQGIFKGAAAGAAIGSVVPVIGTGIGAGIGATIGAIKKGGEKIVYSENGGREAANKIRANIKPAKDGVDNESIKNAILQGFQQGQNLQQGGGGGPNQGPQTGGNNSTQTTPQNAGQNQQGGPGLKLIQPTGPIQRGNQNNNPTPPANPQPTPPNPPTPPTP